MSFTIDLSVCRFAPKPEKGERSWSLALTHAEDESARSAEDFRREAAGVTQTRRLPRRTPVWADGTACDPCFLRPQMSKAESTCTLDICSHQKRRFNDPGSAAGIQALSF